MSMLARRIDRPLRPALNSRSGGRRVTGLFAAAVLTLTGCSGMDNTDSGGTARPGTLDVVVSFYPLQFISERIGGSRVEVTNLTAPGAEPHDLELAPRAIGTVADASAVVYLKGFQPAVDEAVTQNAADRALDVSGPAKLVDTSEQAGEQRGEQGDGQGSNVGHDHPGDGAGHDHAEGTDPHFWLDPTRLAAVSAAVADRFAELDPDHAAEFRRNLSALQGDLTTLDGDFRSTLSQCASTELVTSHAAFGYLADRYGLHQHSVSGLDPSTEPSPAALGELTAFVRQHKVSTIYTETLASPAVAKTLASEAGAKTAVLDPLEGLTSAESKETYLTVMRKNLATLKTGQGCR